MPCQPGVRPETLMRIKTPPSPSLNSILPIASPVGLTKSPLASVQSAAENEGAGAAASGAGAAVGAAGAASFFPQAERLAAARTAKDMRKAKLRIGNPFKISKFGSSYAPSGRRRQAAGALAERLPEMLIQNSILASDSRRIFVTTEDDDNAPENGGEGPNAGGGQSGGATQQVSIEEEMRRSYLDYAMSVIVSRAIPDARDGLKPVHRRVLWSMHEAGYTHTQPYRKSARVVGDVIGKYHPHGDQSVYDALARMAQPFSLRYPLVDGHGNFGNVDGYPPAAMRYTEVRMDKTAEALLADIEKDTVSYQPNYDGSEKEPTVLPARFPNLLVNGAGGIAVGMATNIPPHNLIEVVNATIAMIDKPDITDTELLEIVPGPDFPTGGIILGRAGSKAALLLGRGSG